MSQAIFTVIKKSFFKICRGINKVGNKKLKATTSIETVFFVLICLVVIFFAVESYRFFNANFKKQKSIMMMQKKRIKRQTKKLKRKLAEDDEDTIPFNSYSSKNKKREKY